MCEGDENKPRGQLPPLVLVSRETWGALPPKEKGEPMHTPITQVIVSFMTDTEKGESEDDCKKIMQGLQKRHMGEGLPDVAYNFVVGGDGQVYEGSGWGIQPCNPKFPEFKHKRLDIAYMGNLDRTQLSWEMFKAAIQLLSGGVDNKLIDREYNTIEDPDTAPELDV